MASIFRFPQGFVWGAATAAFQIEGGWNKHGKGESIWDRWCHNAGVVKNGDTGDVACNHYRLYRRDMSLVKKIGLPGYRFSISWPRVQPDGLGKYNQRGLDFYDRLIDNMLAKGVTKPCATLYHWDLPQNLQAKFGGWNSRDVLKHFADYSSEMVRRFSDRVPMWCTHNEPWCTTYFGYEWAVWAPGVRGQGRQVHHNLLVSHGLAVQAARAAARRPIEIGIALSLSSSEPRYPEDQDLADAAMLSQDQAWFDPLYRGTYAEDFAAGIADLQADDMKVISTPADFVGVQYYFRQVLTHVEADKDKPIPGSKYTAFGWEVNPQGFRNLLTHVSRKYGSPPLYVTENGSCWNDVIINSRVHDSDRTDYLRGHIQQMALSMQEGANIKGYFAWSLLDNFEWNEGYSKRFGLVYVDYPTQRRIIKDSGRWYGCLAKANAIELPQAMLNW